MSWRPAIQHEASVPLHVQIRRGIKDAVRRGELAPEEKLPGIRSLAEILGVNRLTVLKAIQALTRAGLLVSIQGKGVFVSPHSRGLIHPGPRDPELTGPFFEGLSGPEAEAEPDGAPVADGFKAAVDDMLSSDHLAFSAGFPPSEMIPTEVIRTRLNRLLRQARGPSLLGYTSMEGYPALREELRFLLQQRGLHLAEDDHIFITGGCQQGIVLCLEAILRSGESLAMESPGYMGTIAACQLKQIPMTPIQVDGAGLSPDRLESAVRREEIGAVYTVPNYQNPTGVTQSLRRRRQIMELVRRHGLYLIEDDIYGDLRLGGRGIAPLKSLPGGERVVYLGSFSKSLAPGLRIGYMVASGELADSLLRRKGIADVCTGTLAQALVAQLLSSGFYRRHLVRARREYRRRRDAMVESLSAVLPPGARFTRPKGGLHLWVMLDRPVDPRRLLDRCRRVGVTFSPGTLFFCDGRSSGTFRLNFSSLPPEQIEEGMTRLGSALAALETTKERRK